MIVCKKCGEKYEDDMPRCLWCDAPNPEHPLNRAKVSAAAAPNVAEQPIAKQPTAEPATPTAAEPAEPVPPSAVEVSPTLNETATVTEIEQDQDAAIEQQFRQKGFLWSVVLAGVLVSWLCHHKYLKKTDRFSTKFFLPLFGIQCGFRYLAYMLSKIDFSGIGSPGLFLQSIFIVVVCLLYWFFIGKLGFALLKKAVPNYDPAAFKKRERVGIVIGIPIFALDFIAGYLHYGTTAKMLGTWLGSALR
jgi:hypothetical protein